jgi:c-di-AMP phosphodiesterase-like protein
MTNPISQTLKMNRILSLALMLIGTILLVFMITVEDEPGALPLFLLLVGTVWFFINRYQIKKHLRKS